MVDGTLMNSFLILSVCIFILFGVSVYLKKWNKKNSQNLGTYEGKVLSKISLVKGANLFVVKVGERSFLIGASDKNISLIADLDAKVNSSLHSSINTSDNNFNLENDFPNPSYFSSNKLKELEISENNSIIKGNEISNISENLSFKTFLKSTFSKNKN